MDNPGIKNCMPTGERGQWSWQRPGDRPNVLSVKNGCRRLGYNLYRGDHMKRKPRLILFPLAENVSGDLVDLINEKFDYPDLYVLYADPVEPHLYYRIGKNAIHETRKDEYHNYYLVCDGPATLIAIIAAKLVANSVRFKCIEIEVDDNGMEQSIRSLDCP